MKKGILPQPPHWLTFSNEHHVGHLYATPNTLYLLKLAGLSLSQNLLIFLWKLEQIQSEILRNMCNF